MELPAPHNGFPLLSLLIFGPLLAAAVVLVLRETWVKSWTLASMVFFAGVSLFLLCGFEPAAGFQWVEQRQWIAALGVEYTLGVDGISLVLVLLTTLIGPFCVLASWRGPDKRQREFMLCLLLMQSAMTGVFCALDLVLFFVFWEAMLIPMTLLIGVWGGAGRVYAAIKFFLYTMAGSILLIAAIIALRVAGGTFSIPALMGQDYAVEFQRWVFLAMFISFAIKVPLLPFHTWLPAAHVQAPTAGSVLLASILLKMGTYGFLRFCLPMTPLGAVWFAPVVLWLSVVAILYGGLAALAQSDLKKIVAYSSVAHMGFACLGIFSLVTDGMVGGALVMINHGITTGALFIMVGMLYQRLGTRELGAAAGLGKRMPVMALFLGVFCLSSLGFPGTNSFVGEFLVVAGAFGVSLPLALATIPGIVVAAAYNLRVLQRVAYGSEKNPDHSSQPDLDWREIITLVPFLVFVFWIGLKPGPFVDLMQPSLIRILEIVQNVATLP